ncbi:MAG: protein-glutamate O-methyltransferase CheR, partial [Oligoflexia bacterium]|nr:protein-glutamate O-methyltransferase CheR [Oligoflexia bacterium]
ETYKLNLQILGTDISRKSIEYATIGKYNPIEIERGLPKEILVKYFDQTSEKNFWLVRNELRLFSSFKQLNLMEDFTYLGKFDIIFCRNVAIYFGAEDKKKVFCKISKMLKGNSPLLIGSTESIEGICPEIESKRYLGVTYYQLKEPAVFSMRG